MTCLRRRPETDRFKHPAQDVRAAKGRKREQRADRKVFAEGHLNIEQRKDDDLRHQGNGKADRDVGQSITSDTLSLRSPLDVLSLRPD